MKMYKRLGKQRVILLVALAIFSLGASSCDRKYKEFDFWQLEFVPEVGYQWCIPIVVDGREACKKAMSIPVSLKEGMIGVTGEGFEELTKQYNKLKRDCGK